MEIYQDPIIKKYIELIQAKCGEIKTFYQGEPTRVPVSNLPCVIIGKTETRADNEANSLDKHDIYITITVVADIRTELSTSENDAHVVEGVAKLYDLMEGRDEDTFNLKDTSILQILRTNALVDEAHNLRTNINTATRVNYGTTLQNRHPEEWRIEASIEFVANFIQIR